MAVGLFFGVAVDSVHAQTIYYGMSIDTSTGDVTGEFWNDGLGWIDVSAVVLNPTNGEFSGNANIVGLTNAGQNGVLSFRGDCTPSCGGYGVNLNLTTNIITGNAWNDRIGWVVFETPYSVAEHTPGFEPSVGGYAWNDNIGWISLSERLIAPSAGCDATAFNTCLWAWNDEIGWISHNSLDNPSAPSFGVHIDAGAGTVSGFAWNTSTDYIDFAGATYNSVNGQVSGTAQITGYGASGALILRGDCVPSCGGYGVTVAGNGAVTGYAWNQIIGWVEFAPAFGGVFYDANQNPSVYGWAWNNAVGWISMRFTEFDAEYGVNMRDDGTFDGYAWSDNVGWIDYRPAGPYPSAPQQTVRWDPVSGQVSGWAKILNMGNDGWIKYRNSGADPIAYGVTINAVTGTWRGYAWNDKIGWINFQHQLTNTHTTINLPEGPLRPILIEPLDCVDTYTINPAAPLTPALDWSDYAAADGSTQAAFQIMLDDDPLFGSPVFDETVASTASIYSVGLGDLVYNVAYYWRVRVQSSNSEWSEWGTTGTLGTETNCFRTPIHPAPVCDFDMTPATPVLGEPTQFTDTTQFFGGATGAFWGWNFGDGSTLAGSDPGVHRNPEHEYTSLGVVTVTHNVTDSDGYSCTVDNAVNVSQVLPEFDRVIPR